MADDFTTNSSQPSADILVVDDHQEITELVAEALSDEGYHVRVAHDGLSALCAIRSHPPDLLILDVAMPVMRGDQLVQQLRSDGAKNLPIILMTADRAPERYADLGANQLLQKPFDLGALLKLVASCVGLVTSRSWRVRPPKRLPIDRELGA